VHCVGDDKFSCVVKVNFNNEPGGSDVGKAIVSGGNVVLPWSGYDRPL
jgi:hypothetical protein